MQKFDYLECRLTDGQTDGLFHGRRHVHYECAEANYEIINRVGWLAWPRRETYLNAVVANIDVKKRLKNSNESNN